MTGTLRWFKSSYSSSTGGECLEAAHDSDAIHLRDSKSPDGPTLTASFGVAENRPPDTWRDLLDRAEAALTRAKRAGRNRCEVA